VYGEAYFQNFYFNGLADLGSVSSFFSIFSTIKLTFLDVYVEKCRNTELPIQKDDGTSYFWLYISHDPNSVSNVSNFFVFDSHFKKMNLVNAKKG
jgi:hypothetical protein